MIDQFSFAHLINSVMLQIRKIMNKDQNIIEETEKLELILYKYYIRKTFCEDGHELTTKRKTKKRLENNEDIRKEIRVFILKERLKDYKRKRHQHLESMKDSRLAKQVQKYKSTRQA